MPGAERAVVTEVRAGRRGSSRRTIWLDGDPWRATTARIVRELGVAPGLELDPDAFDETARALETVYARERSLRLLAYRERSSAELVSRLVDDGYPSDIADTTVAALAESGLVDDGRFAANLSRSLVEARGLGRQRALRRMTQLGIPEELAEAALTETAPAEGEAARALDAGRRAWRPSDTRDRLAQRLIRRGFDTRRAIDAADTVLEEHRTRAQEE